MARFFPLRGEVNKVALTAFIPAVVEVVATTTTSTTSSSALAVQRQRQRMVGDATGGVKLRVDWGFLSEFWWGKKLETKLISRKGKWLQDISIYFWDQSWFIDMSSYVNSENDGQGEKPWCWPIWSEYMTLSLCQIAFLLITAACRKLTPSNCHLLALLILIIWLSLNLGPENRS